MSKTSITWYIARNHEGEFSCGETYDGDTYWVDDLKDARFHETIGPVKAAVTKWVKRHPDTPIPEILEWTIDIATAKVIDVAGETSKRIKRAALAKAAKDEVYRKQQLVWLEEQEARIRAQREELAR
jgi:hypothetical protein